jgi:signal peptidase I
MLEDRMKEDSLIKEILDWCKYIAAAVIAALVINAAVLVNAQVMSPSMESTMMTGSRFFGFRWAYAFGEPERFDIIVFNAPDKESTDPYVKRIIGLPGEKLEIKDGKVYINDGAVPLDDKFIKDKAFGNYGPYNVPQDSYFVMGDNRDNSNDSRFWNNKFVTKENIIGKVFMEWFPSPKLF